MKKIWAMGIIALLVLGVGLAAASVSDKIEIGPAYMQYKLAEDSQDTQTMEYDKVINNLEILPAPKTEESKAEKIEITPDYLSKFETIEEGTIKEISPRSYHFSGSLDCNRCRQHGTFSWSEGERVHIWGSWTPNDQVLDVGIFDRNAGAGYVYRFTGGTFNRIYTVPWSSNNWAIFVGNPCPPNTETVFYNGDAEEL